MIKAAYIIQQYKSATQEVMLFVQKLGTKKIVIRWRGRQQEQRRKEYKDEIVNSLRYCIEKKNLELYAWCTMTSHTHLIIGTSGNPLENIMRDLKRHTSEKLHLLIKRNATESRREWLLAMMEKAGRENSNNCGFQLWQQHNQPIELSTKIIMHQKSDYLHNNPVTTGFVEKPEDWLYSSAKNYYMGKKGIIDISLIDPMVISY